MKGEAGNAKQVESGAGNQSAPKAEIPPIVAIGASAGGLEALQKFFENMPEDSGIGFVVVTHARPQRESMLPELLSNSTNMPVSSSEEGMAVKQNQVVVAKDSFLTIKHGVLSHVKEFDASEVSYHSIDYFFRALAADRQERAIGIVLSGSGNDGTLGIKAIKAAGGIAMVQDPSSAKYAGMPESALSTGLTDYVKQPEDLPEALLDYCRGPYLAISREKEIPMLPDEAVHAILVRLRAHSGDDFTHYKKSTMERRIQRRMTVHRLDTPHEYIKYLKENPRELDVLLQELVISVTSFFRDREAFQANESFYRSFNLHRDQIEVSLFFELDAGQWNIAEPRRLLEQFLPERGMMTDYRVELDFPRIGRRAFLLNARQLQAKKSLPNMILLAFEDITERT
jgi:two-component system CheB/CheR fusion protein